MKKRSRMKNHPTNEHERIEEDKEQIVNRHTYYMNCTDMENAPLHWQNGKI